MKETIKTFKALSDETRLRILHLLLEAGEICVCDMETVLGCPQARISRHLAILRNAGFIDDRREALWVLYSLAKPLRAPQNAALKAVKEVVSLDAFAQDKKRLREAIDHGRCKTFQIIKPDALPRYASR
ncbi:MAG: metalloregulator ArsR/SmtB family transcription factor [Terriglobia bacterium]